MTKMVIELLLQTCKSQFAIYYVAVRRSYTEKWIASRSMVMRTKLQSLTLKVSLSWKSCLLTVRNSNVGVGGDSGLDSRVELAKVGEGWRRLAKVGEGWRWLEKVGEGWRRLEMIWR